MKATFYLVRLTFLATLSLVLITSCVNDDFYGFDFSNDDDIETSISEGLQFSNHLTISSLNTASWTEDDFASFCSAVERIGVTFSESRQKYVFGAKNGRRINVSDSLYDKVIEMFEHTNKIIASSNSKVTRKKDRTREQGFVSPDCVPAAIANMNHEDAPTYDEAIAKCNQLFPFWRILGGVPIDSVESFIEEYVPVTRYTIISSNTIGNQALPNYVMRFCSGAHAVNAYNFNYSYYAGQIIYYHDYSATSHGDGSLFVSQMYDIFIF